MDAEPAARPGSSPLVIIPTYNEVKSLPGLLDALMRLGGVEVLVVDDNSPDGTADRVRGHPEFGRSVHLLARPGKLGLGSAYREGFQWALARPYTSVVQIDADLSHDPNDIPGLLGALDSGADMAIGSRYSQGINVVHWPLRRLLLSMGAGAYVRLLTGLPLADPTSGFKAIRRSVVERFDWAKVAVEGYGFQIALHFFAERAGFRLVEVPIIFTERRNGRSKLSGSIALEACWLVLRLAAGRILRRRGRPAMAGARAGGNLGHRRNPSPPPFKWGRRDARLEGKGKP